MRYRRWKSLIERPEPAAFIRAARAAAFADSNIALGSAVVEFQDLSAAVRKKTLELAAVPFDVQQGVSGFTIPAR